MIELVLFLLFIIGTPGPANMISMLAATESGLKQTLKMVAGIAVGLAFLSVVVGLGFSTIQQYPNVVLAMKLISAGYMIWLSIQAWRGNGHALHVEKYTFVKGLFIQPLNPKAWVFTILAWSTYSAGVSADVMWQFVGVTAALMGVTFTSQSTYAVAGSLMNRVMSKSRTLTRVLVVMNVAVVLWALTL